MKGIFDDLINIANASEQKGAQPTEAPKGQIEPQPENRGDKEISPETFYGSAFNEHYKAR